MSAKVKTLGIEYKNSMQFDEQNVSLIFISEYRFLKITLLLKCTFQHRMKYYVEQFKVDRFIHCFVLDVYEWVKWM